MKSSMKQLQLLRYSRHDWLNRVQVIKGNLKLGNYDRINTYLDEIIEKEKKASLLTLLCIEDLAFLLLTWNWKSSPIVVDFEIEGDTIDLSKMDKALYTQIDAILKLLENHAYIYQEHYLNVTFQIFESEVNIYLDYRGKLNNLEGFMIRLNEKLSESQIEFLEPVGNEEELTIQYVARLHH